MRLLIASTMDSKQPFGAFTRPFYLGMYLSKQFEVCQIGLDTSAIHYTQTVSVGSRSLRTYIQTINQAVQEFNPDLIYAQETLPGIAALISSTRHRCPLVFDFHTLSAFEYWTRLSSTTHKLQELKQFVKTYLAQGSLIAANKLIIAASQATIEMIPQWYPLKLRIQFVGNGVPEDLLQAAIASPPDPYLSLRPKRVVVVIAPKAVGYEFPSNDMSVSMTVEVAQYLESRDPFIHFVVIGRNADSVSQPLPGNITFAGFLPSRADFLAYVAQADIGLLPFPKEAVAGGARNKALDFLACKTLVVSTPEGLRGLDEFQHQKHLLMSGYSTQEVAETILEACKTYDQYNAVTEAAYDLVTAKYSWQAMADQVAERLRDEI